MFVVLLILAAGTPFTSRSAASTPVTGSLNVTVTWFRPPTRLTGAATVVQLVGLTAGLGRLYAAGVACVIVLLIVEHALVSPRDLSRVNVAFFTVNGVVGLVLGVLGVLDVVLS